MRILIAALALVTAAGPAAAQQRAPARSAPSAAEIGTALRNPVVQDALASAIVGLADSVMATRVGPLARYTDPRAGIRPEDTLADLRRRDDPEYRAHLYDDARRGVAGAGALAGDAAALAGELGATVERLRSALAPLAAAADGYRRRD